MRKEIIFELVILILGSVVFAVPDTAFDSSTSSNATWRNGTVGLSNILINVTANSSITANSSSFVQWYNATNASTNVSALIGQTANLSGTNRVNYTYWTFNITNDGVHRFDVILLVNASIATSANETSASIQRYIYYDNTTAQLTLNSPGSGQEFQGSGSTVSVLVNYTGGDATSRDQCYYRLDNASASIISGCSNTSISVDIGRAFGFNMTINDSAGNANSTYIGFTTASSQGGGGGGGGGQVSTPVTTPSIVTPATTPQQDVTSQRDTMVRKSDPIKNFFANITRPISNFFHNIWNLLFSWVKLK